MTEHCKYCGIKIIYGLNSCMNCYCQYEIPKKYQQNHKCNYCERFLTEGIGVISDINGTPIFCGEYCYDEYNKKFTKELADEIVNSFINEDEPILSFNIPTGLKLSYSDLGIIYDSLSDLSKLINQPIICK